MKKIKDYQPGDEVVDLILRITDLQFRKTTSNADYVSMLGFDGEDLIETKVWKLTDEIRGILKNGEIYAASGVMKDYQGKMQFNVKDLRLTNENDEYDVNDFYEFAKIDKEELKNEIMQYILKIDNPIIKKVVFELIKENFNQYFVHPAAKTMHHNYISGLAYHVYSMLKLSDAYLSLYPYFNKDLVYGGIIIHDLGKLIEMTSDSGEYTKEGNLLGHITIATNKLYKKAVELKVENTEEVLMLQHIIISHHGHMEYGSPKEPTIPEAALIFMLDYSDSRLASLEKEICKNNVIVEDLKGNYTQPLTVFDRKSFYIPKLK